MMKKYYPNFTLEEEPEEGYNLTLSYDLSEVPQLENAKMSKLSSEERKALKKKKQEFKDVKAKLSKEAEALACFRRNFFAAPFESMIEGIIAGNWTGSKCEFQARDSEYIWLIPGKDSLNVIFSLHFFDEIDTALCKVILNEFEDKAGRINGAPSIKKMKDDVIPEILKEEFPESGGIKEDSKTSNGII